ncbi:MAG: serine/threonine-protein kinase PknK [Deltaproteobacteria bacterium]|nr:serine/threonine-protein kinase PknK [Deltaproteobacteria bacterium]
MRQTLGVQGAVETLLAFDLQSSREVIVRTAPQTALPSATWMRLVHEAAVLETLEPLDLSRPIATGTDAGVVYLATEFVPGITLAQRLTRGPLTVHETLSIAASVLTALHATHERGILHRDLHPERLIVAAEGVIERATLVGFGFTRSLAHELSLRDLPASAALHVSPEQAGLIERGVDGRSDLYSVGAVMFECLTGQPLFAGTSLGEILRKHLTSPVPLLAGRVAGVPRVLDELLERLLRKDPRDRYQSAQAALADVIALDEALARGIAEPTLVVGLRDRRRSLAEPRFVGREAEVSSLEVELSRAAAGNGRLVVIEGPSGAGKSRLLDEFARVATRRGAFVLRGRASETEAQLAGHLLAGLSRSVVSELLERPALRQRLATALEGRTHALHSLFPELAQVLGESALPGGPELYGEQRTVEALAVLFGALGDRERPLVLMLDDFQWAPDRAVRLALEWARRAGNLRGQVFVSFVVATRADELGPHHPVRALSAEGVRLELPALTADEIRQLADSMAGPLPA